MKPDRAKPQRNKTVKTHSKGCSSLCSLLLEEQPRLVPNGKSKHKASSLEFKEVTVPETELGVNDLEAEQSLCSPNLSTTAERQPQVSCTFTKTTCSVFWISLPAPVREKPSAPYNQRDLEGGQLLEDHPSHPGLEEFYEAVINTAQAREGQNARSKGLPGMPGCGNGAHSCAYERVTPKK